MPQLQLKQEGTLTRSAWNYRVKDLRQTKAKLKKGSQVLNLLSLSKLVIFFIVSNLVTLCNAACPDVATVPTQLSVNVSGILGATSNKLTTSGYSLT